MSTTPETHSGPKVEFSEMRLNLCPYPIALYNKYKISATLPSITI